LIWTRAKMKTNRLKRSWKKRKRMTRQQRLRRKKNLKTQKKLNKMLTKLTAVHLLKGEKMKAFLI